MPRLLAVLCALSIGACTQDQAQDPLAPAEIARVAEDGGDARGEALTGQYVTASELLACDCPARMGVNLCTPQSAGLIGLDGPSSLVQVDGYLTMQPEWVSLPWALSGALDRDGEFLLAGLSRLELGVNALAVAARFAGSFAADRSFAGELDLRLSGDVPGGAVDCRISFAVDGAPVPQG